MTPLKKDLAILEFNIFFDITDKNEKWRLYWSLLRKNWKQSVHPDHVAKQQNK